MNVQTIEVIVRVKDDDGCHVEKVERSWKAASENKQWIIQRINSYINEVVGKL